MGPNALRRAKLSRLTPCGLYLQRIISRQNIRKSHDFELLRTIFDCAYPVNSAINPLVFLRNPAMLRRLPPLNALKVFEAAARSESFTRAAQELCVTQGAVSHQVKALEATLGIKLFNRERQRLVLTEAGREYLAVVRDALDRIAVGTDRLVQRQNSGVLTVSTSTGFCRQMARIPARSVCGGSSRHRSAGVRNDASCRLRTRGSRPCGSARRRQLGRARRRAPLLRASFPGLRA